MNLLAPCRMAHADALYFERFPRRRYRVRLASRAEIEQASISVPFWLRVYVAVHQISPGIRLRAFLTAPEGMETDLPEALARSVFEKAVTA